MLRALQTVRVLGEERERERREWEEGGKSGRVCEREGARRGYQAYLQATAGRRQVAAIPQGAAPTVRTLTVCHYLSRLHAEVSKLK